MIFENCIFKYFLNICFEYFAIYNLNIWQFSPWLMPAMHCEKKTWRKNSQEKVANQPKPTKVKIWPCIYLYWAALQHRLVFFQAVFSKETVSEGARNSEIIYTLFLRLLQALIKSPKWMYYIKICVISSRPSPAWANLSC